jgi:hypothetical protein
MAASRGPRIGRADRLVALREGRYARVFTRDIFGAAKRTDLETLLAAPTVAPVQPAPPPPAAQPQSAARVREAVCDRAEQLAQQLEPLPGALAEIATRISRHCGATARDAELSALVEAVRARTWELSCAVRRLAKAAKGDS